MNTSFDTNESEDDFFGINEDSSPTLDPNRSSTSSTVPLVYVRDSFNIPGSSIHLKKVNGENIIGGLSSSKEELFRRLSETER